MRDYTGLDMLRFRKMALAHPETGGRELLNRYNSEYPDLSETEKRANIEAWFAKRELTLRKEKPRFGAWDIPMIEVDEKDRLMIEELKGIAEDFRKMRQGYMEATSHIPWFNREVIRERPTESTDLFGEWMRNMGYSKNGNGPWMDGDEAISPTELIARHIDWKMENGQAYG